MKSMYRYEAFYKKTQNNHLLQNSKFFGTEARFVIIAESEARALELIDKKGENSQDFFLDKISSAKNKLGKYYPESIKDSRI